MVHFVPSSYPHYLQTSLSCTFVSEALLLCMKEKNEEGALELVRSERGLLHEACFQQNLEAVAVLLDLGVSSAEWNKVRLLSVSSAVMIHNGCSCCCHTYLFSPSFSFY